MPAMAPIPNSAAIGEYCASHRLQDELTHPIRIALRIFIVYGAADASWTSRELSSERLRNSTQEELVPLHRSCSIAWDAQIPPPWCSPEWILRKPYSLNASDVLGCFVQRILSQK
jgi:hypothetical protein